MRLLRCQQDEGWVWLGIAAWAVIPNPYPWYSLWLVAVAALSLRSRAAAVAIALSLTSVLRYVPDAAGALPAPLPLPAEQITALLARADAFVRTRDIASARLLYERAADAGNGRAALRMGESFDPAFLDSMGIFRMLGDRQLALSWYRRARDLGDAEAAQLLQKLEPR